MERETLVSFPARGDASIPTPLHTTPAPTLTGRKSVSFPIHDAAHYVFMTHPPHTSINAAGRITVLRHLTRQMHFIVKGIIRIGE